jgi:DNA repair protein RecO (recombination protein O)
VRRIESEALLVRSVPYGESDVVATFFTATDGKLGAMVRGARRSSRRFGGALEPIHELRVTLDDRGKELCTLAEARIARPRYGIVADLPSMDAAGRALRWVRHLCPPRTPEPAAFGRVRALFDALDAAETRDPVLGHLAVFGLHLLADVGYALDFERCVRCGRPCPLGRPSFIDAAGGGLVCTACGCAPRPLTGELRALAARALRGEAITLTEEPAGQLVAVVEEAMAAHADFDPGSKR